MIICLLTGTVAMVQCAALDLQSRIDRAAEAAGGTVVVEKGEWVSKPFVMKSNVTLQLDEGAVVRASTNLADYAHMPRGQRYFVFAEGATNFTVRGRGVLDGSGSAFRESRRLDGESQPQDLPIMMRFSRCRNLRLEDFTFRQGGAWGCHLRNCDGVVVRGVTCYNHASSSTNDGIDIEASNVLVENCDFDTGDDAVVFKTESDKTFPVTNVVVRNCRIASCCNGVKFGTGSYCDVRDVLIENCRLVRAAVHLGRPRNEVFPGVTNAVCGIAGLALECVDGGRLEDVTIRNCTIEGYMSPVFIRLGNRRDPKPGHESALRNVLIENVKGTADSRIASSITGVPVNGLRPRDITLRNVDFTFPGGGTVEDRNRPVPEMVRIGNPARLNPFYPELTMFHLGWPDDADFNEVVLPAWGFYLRHADNVTFEQVRLHCVGADARKPIVADDCENFQIRQGLRGAAPYRLVAREGVIDWASLRPDFCLSPSGIEAWPDRFDTVTRGRAGSLEWGVFRDRATGGCVLVYQAASATVADSDWAALLQTAVSHDAAIVGGRAAAPGWKNAQRNSPEWDWRRTDLGLWYDPGRVAPYEFRIDAPRNTPELTKGAAHVFDFSVHRPDEPVAAAWDEYVPERMADGEFANVPSAEIDLTPKPGDTPIRTIAETGMTLFGLRERYPEKTVVLHPLVDGDANSAAVVNKELRAFAAEKGVRLEGFASAEAQETVQRADRPASRVAAGSSTRGAWWWFRRMAQKNREIRRSGGTFDLVMLGDSITHFWEGCAYWTAGRAAYEQLAKRRKILNLGYGGDSTQNLLWRILNGELDGYQAKYISLMIGTNNTTAPEETAAAVRRILAVISEKQPEARVILTALLPRGEPDSPARLRVRRVNELIRPLAGGGRVRWLDMTDDFLQSDGRLAPGLMTDERSPKTGLQCNLHPYETGYEAWCGRLLKLIDSEH